MLLTPDTNKIYDYVLKFYSIRPRSKKELLDWFKRKNVEQETQETITQKLEHLNLINDEEFARWWVEQRTNYRHSGFRLIKMELRQKGVSDEIISGIESRVSSISELESARKIVEKKLKTFILSEVEGPNPRNTLTGLLARRGFSWETIKTVVDEVFKKE